MNGTESYSTLELPTLTHSSCLSSRCFSIHLPFIPVFLFRHYLFHSGPLFHAQTVLYVHIQYAYAHTRAHLLSLCEPLLRRQVWVERPLGSGSRYCRIERRSILDPYSSTEQWGEQNQSILVRMQDILQSSSVHCLDFGPQTPLRSLTCLSADNFISVFQHFMSQTSKKDCQDFVQC